MRFVLIVAIVFGICVTQCTADTVVPAETTPTVEEGLWPPMPLPRETPAYIGAPVKEPLRPVRAAGSAKLVAPPIAIVAPPPPVLPPPPPTPKFDRDAPAGLTLVWPAPGTGIEEGDGLLVWNTGGPIAYVRLSYSGDRCALGGKARGSFSQTIGKVTTKGTYHWAVPYMDAPQFKLQLTGYGVDGKQLAAAEVTYQFRPRYLKDKPETFIVVSKSRQRLWYVKDGRIKRMHMISTAAGGFTTPNMKPGSYDRKRGAMGRVFGKQYAPMSREYHVIM